MTRARRFAALAAPVAGLVLAATVGAGTAEAAPGSDAPSEGTRTAQRLGLQTVPKRAANARSAPAGVNPLLSLPTDPSAVDLAGWRAQMRATSKARNAKSGAENRVAAPLLVDEQEPDAIRGGNDAPANAQAIPQFGSNKRPAARVLGTLAPSATPATRPATAEDDGSIPLAGETGLTGGRAVRTSGTIGDGPHGSAGDGTGDFDFFAIRGASAGQRLIADIDTPTGSLDSIVVLYAADGTPVAANDDGPDGLDSLLTVTIPADGDWYVAVLGYAFPDPLPADPNDSGSGNGAGSEGAYQLTLGLDSADIDVYAVTLRAGDVFSGSVTGSGTLLETYDPDETLVFGSGQDFSGIYPANSPLPGGGNAVFDHVAAKAGTHYVAVSGGLGNYDLTLEVRRPGPQAAKVTQTIFLDFDGQRLNTNIFGGPGVRTLSPLSAFTGRWGITNAQYDALVNRIVDTVTENLKRDFAGTNVQVRILNSRDHADPFGAANVSRLIVGGTVAESGVDTIGIAQSIDPGNYDTQESAIILLDYLSEAAGPAYSLNTYIGAGTNRVRFVGTAIGNVASHEAGHYLGNWHVDQFNDVLNLMDQGGNFPLLYGVGPDGTGGTADDPDVDFGQDVLNPNEGFTGLENTRARTRWALASAS